MQDTLSRFGAVPSCQLVHVSNPAASFHAERAQPDSDVTQVGRAQEAISRNRTGSLIA